MYEGYKGQRQACPDAVKEAVPRLQHLLRAMGVPVISVGGWAGGRAGGWVGASLPSGLRAATCGPPLCA